MIRRGLALLSGGPAFAAALSAQTVPAPQFFSAQLSASCFVAVVPTHECFRQADLLVHDQRLNAKARDYRYEGLAIGAAAGGVGGLLLSWALCGQSDEVGKSCTGTVIAGTLGGAALGGLAGLLIGGMFPKEAPTPRDSVPE